MNIIKYLPCLICAAVGGFFAWLFYIRFWLWRDCIEEALSSCLTPDGDNLTSGGMLWSVPAFVFLFCAVLCFLKAR